MKKQKVVVGSVVGRWEVLADLGIGSNNRRSYFCRCVCGTTKKLHASTITGLNPSKSCGCYRSDRLTTHGHTHRGCVSREYNSWVKMVQRCTNKANKDYQRYGGRGITVSNEWLDFEKFINDMGVAPDGTTLNRKNNNGNYEQDNCNWATATEQANNRGSNVCLTHNNQTMTVAQWAKVTGLGANLYSRLYRGWSPIAALTTPKKQKKQGM